MTDLAFSPDGGVLATSGVDGALDLWSVADGAPIWTKGSEEGGVEGISFDADGSSIAAAWSDVVRILETSTGRLVGTIDVKARDTSLSPRGDRIALANDRIHVVDVRTARHRFPPMPPSSPTETSYQVDSVAWSPDGSSIASTNVAAVDVLGPGNGYVAPH